MHPDNFLMRGDAFMSVYNPIEDRFETTPHKTDVVLQTILRKSRFAIKDFEKNLDQYHTNGDEIYVSGDLDEVDSAGHLNVVLHDLCEDFDRREADLTTH